MSSIIFKMTNFSDRFSRRLAYTSKPTWSELADKLESIYAIPKDDLFVSYIDADGDEVILNSSEELEDCYKSYVSDEETSGKGDEEVRVIRFTVRSPKRVREGEVNGAASQLNTPATERNVEHNDITGRSTQDNIPTVNGGTERLQVDRQVESGGTDSVSSIESSDVEEIPRGASLGATELETLMTPHHPFVLRGHGRGRGGHGHQGHFHSRGHHGHRGPTHPFPPFPPRFGPTDMPMSPSDAPPSAHIPPSFVATSDPTGMPMPPPSARIPSSFLPHFGPMDVPHAAPPFPGFGRGRGGRRGGMGRGGCFAPHGHIHGTEHLHHHLGQHPLFAAMGADVPPFHGGFSTMRGVQVHSV